MGLRVCCACGSCAVEAEAIAATEQNSSGFRSEEQQQKTKQPEAARTARTTPHTQTPSGVDSLRVTGHRWSQERGKGEKINDFG